MARQHFKTAVKQKIFSDGIRIGESEEAKICLNCPLPASKCKTGRCKRYEEELEKIRRNEKNGKDGKTKSEK